MAKGGKRRDRELYEALVRTESELRATLYSIGDGVISVDTDGMVTMMNPVAEKLTGWNEGEARDRRLDEVFNIVNEETRVRVEDPVKRVLRKGTVIGLANHTILIARDGTERAIADCGSPIYGKGGIITGVVLVFRDQTEERKAAKVVAEARAFAESIIATVREPLVVLDASLRVLLANRAFYRVFEAVPEETDGHLFYELGNRQWDIPELRRLLEDILPQNTFFDDYEVEHDFPKIGPKTMLLNARRIYREANKTEMILLAIEDISERKRAEEELRLSEERFRQFFRNAPMYCYMVSPEGILLDLNKAALDVLGHEREEVVGRPVATIYAPEYYSKVVENLETWEETGRLEEVEMEIITKTGKRRTVILSAGAVRDREGKILHSISVQRDITERKHLEEQLRQAQKMEAIGRLAGGIAHDFNNLLTVIKGTCQLSLLDIREGDPLRANLKEIEKSAERAADLTRQLLAFSRKQIMEMRVIDINAVIKNLEKMLRRVLGEDIELATFLADGIGRVKADPGQMEQVIINLVLNARDAMPEGGKLTIETCNVELDEEYTEKHFGVERGAYVLVSISDMGVGMTPEMKEKVFEPFFTTKEVGKGTGLGLSTVYGIVKQSGGNIWVYSEPGQGTTFKIYLPRVEDPLEDLKEKTIKEVPRGSETVLVVEDEDVVRKLAVRLLKTQGYKVLEASDGGKAFMLCEEYKGPIHLVLSDVVMPGVSGRQLVERLKEIHPEAKALYMSGYTENVILHHGVLEKGIDFVQKPFTIETLARKVREVLDKGTMNN
ncbi:MAG: PAS domain S-box protein [Syntrophaceae bacterium]|nr:PAS domain S-box protein [Syntrophaceae bacterium]